MKNVLVVMVAVALAAGVAFKASATDTAAMKVKETTKTVGSETITTEKAKVKTPEMKEKVKEVTTTTKNETVTDTKVSEKYKKGDLKKETIKTDVEKTGEFTKKTTTVAIKPGAGDVKKDVVTIKSFNEYDPKNAMDNTVLVLNNQKQVELPLASNWKQNHVQKFKAKEVTITSTYNPARNSYEVTDIQPTK